MIWWRKPEYQEKTGVPGENHEAATINLTLKKDRYAKWLNFLLIIKIINIPIHYYYNTLNSKYFVQFVNFHKIIKSGEINQLATIQLHKVY